MYYLTEFVALNKKNIESASEFNKRFNNIYNKFPNDIHPSQATAKVTYPGAYEDDFAIILREIISTTLANMQDDAFDVEGKITTSGKVRHRKDFQRRGLKMRLELQIKIKKIKMKRLKK